ncbi:MAG: hypothetical protein AAGE01_04825 [Pseudomonadota bacterium]
MRSSALALLALVVPATVCGLDGDGLAEDDGVTDVRNHCVACHSPQLIIQNRGSANRWRELIRWMQAEHGLWPLRPQVETAIVTYLARNYGPDERSRRKPLAPELMPPLPGPTPRASK